MKVGILTFHRSQNYGALLQAYGLQTFLEGLGHKVSMVDYWPDYHKDMYRVFSWSIFKRMSFLAKVRYLIYSVGTFYRTIKRQKSTNDFIVEYLHVSTEKKFDAVIYGSDQIWRKYFKNDWGDFNPVYWGNQYVDAPLKIAYAASMGEIIVENGKDRNFIIKHLSNFDAISIREKDLVEYFEKEFGEKYQLVCDPVFLLNREQWEKMVNHKQIPPQKYILYYRLQNLKYTDDIVKELSNKTGYSVIETRGYVPLFHYSQRYKFTISAQEFVSLVSGAEYIVTSAFHGIAMSIIFNKQFYYASQKKQANRVDSLLSKLGINDRTINTSSFFKEQLNSIDYNSVNLKLIEWEQESKDWLCNILNSRFESNNH